MIYKVVTASFILAGLCACNQESNRIQKPNVLFIMMDDLGYGHLGINNDTLETGDFDPFYRRLEDSLQGYSMDKALEFTKRATHHLQCVCTFKAGDSHRDHANEIRGLHKWWPEPGTGNTPGSEFQRTGLSNGTYW